jgi:DNA-binding SARP family transcriptional activator
MMTSNLLVPGRHCGHGMRGMMVHTAVRRREPPVFFRALGPVRVEVCASRLGHPLPESNGDAGVLRVSGRRKQTILALLLSCVGQTVSIDRMVDAVWPDTDPPATARKQVQNCAAAVRRELESARCEGHRSNGCRAQIVADSRGYRLDADPQAVDAVTFDHVVRECVSIESRRDGEVVAGLRTALDLWAGAAYAGLPALELQAEAARLDELRLVALEELAGRELRLGSPPALQVAILSELTGSGCGCYMEALHRSGRTSEALERFREYRSMLVAAHGVEPGPEVRAKEREILRCQG